MLPPASEREVLSTFEPFHALEAVSAWSARCSPVCDAEYGVRTDDGALVFHFFPPGYAADNTSKWPSWEAFRDRLEAALLASFDPETLNAGYAEELRSFHAILRPAPRVPDVVALIELFFERLEAPR